ncbi:MAG: circularly permuted type 2 ATP-grasp protein [Pseudomonadota bacterium]
MAEPAPRGAPEFGEALAKYRPVAGAADELVQTDGSVRPVWHGFLDRFGKLSAEEVTARFRRADLYLRDAGVFFRQYDDAGSTERDWPISHIPVLIHEREWSEIADALVQRADLLERVAADLYGPGTLAEEGALPASLIAASREYLRPLVGITPRSGHFLHFLAFEIGRGPNGNWWVMGDRTQAPSGAGFALENRVATARIYADIIRASNTAFLGNFFNAFRETLQGFVSAPDARVAILTPGRLNDAYFEHAYIARYLGFILLEGEDLRVENGRAMVRTIDGLKPIDVLWRRLDSSFADPLELDESSAIGTPGLVDAVRRGGVTMVNALGSGILETRAFLAFLPRIAERLLGEPLKMPNIATWWCGQDAEREHVRANIERMMIGPALSTRPLFEGERTTVLGEGFRSRAKNQIDAFLDAEGPRLVGQEAVNLSTTPAWVDGRLVPRPATIRVFLARTEEGWQVMPGGYARIGRSEDPAAITLQRGGSVADVWVIRDAPPAGEAVTAAGKTPYARPRPGILPSRAADNLFWLGRYVERAEGMMRLLRAYHVRLTEAAGTELPLMRALASHLRGYGIDPMDVTTDGLRQTLSLAVLSAGRVRDRFSVDGWHALTDLQSNANRLAVEAQIGEETAQAMSRLLRMNTGFSGLVHDNMYRFQGWRFLEIGGALERAIGMAGLLAHLTDSDAPDGAFDLAVEIGDSVLTHRRRYTVQTSRETVIDLLALDAMNPRAILFQLTKLRTLIEALPGAGMEGHMALPMRTATRVHATLAVATPDGLDTGALEALRSEIRALSDQVSERYLV